MPSLRLATNAVSIDPFSCAAIFYIFRELAITDRRHAKALGQDVHCSFALCGVTTLLFDSVTLCAGACLRAAKSSPATASRSLRCSRRPGQIRLLHRPDRDALEVRGFCASSPINNVDANIFIRFLRLSWTNAHISKDYPPYKTRALVQTNKFMKKSCTLCLIPRLNAILIIASSLPYLGFFNDSSPALFR